MSLLKVNDIINNSFTKSFLGSLDWFLGVKLTLKSQILHIWSVWQYVNLQNTMISLEYVDFWPKIYLILYLSIGNLKTQVAIARGTLLSNNDEKKFKHSLQMKRKLLLLHSFIRIILSFDEKKIFRRENL